MLRVAVARQHGLERLMRPGQFRRGPLPAAIKTSWSGNCQPQGTCPSWHTWLSSPRKSRSARFPGAPRIQSGSQACRRTTPDRAFCQVSSSYLPVSSDRAFKNRRSLSPDTCLPPSASDPALWPPGAAAGWLSQPAPPAGHLQRHLTQLSGRCRVWSKALPDLLPCSGIILVAG